MRDNTKESWINLDARQPKPGQFVRVEVRERVEHHWLEFEGQARYQPEGWAKADGEPYLTDGQEIRRWKPLLDSGSDDEWDDFIGDLAKD